MSYLIAERFKSVQGEGMYAGTPMAFIRFVGCSVGKKVCNACDTDFEKVHGWHGGGEYTATQLSDWAAPYRHVCLTGGEPLDQDLIKLLERLVTVAFADVHIETSGTRMFIREEERIIKPWICVSPKPGYKMEMLAMADEIKIIVPGLGSGEGWPTLEDALVWANRWPEKPVFLQPRNAKHEVDRDNLALCERLVVEHPELRLSVQLHKMLRVR